MKRFILAHDLGTTGNKATLFDDEGRLVASAFSGYETVHPQPTLGRTKSGRLVACGYPMLRVSCSANHA